MSLVVARAGGSVIAETPIGAIQGYAGTAAPSGWLLCDGSAVSRSTYSELFGVVSTTYGTGDGSTTFNLPNITGYIIYATRLTTRVTVNNPPEFVTALPSSPLDGKEIYYRADDANGVIWHLRYRSGSASSYKWEFVGGPPLSAAVDTDQTTTSATYTDLATVGPTVTTPLAGDYVISFVFTAYVSPAASAEVTASYAVGGTAASDTDSAISAHDSSSSKAQTQGSTSVKTAIAASSAITMKYKRNASTANILRRRLFVTPVRVG